MRADPSFWTGDRRTAVQEAAASWKAAHRLNALPLDWGGLDGCSLRSRQWVGVVEIEGGRIEIYPKTDAALIHKDAPTEAQAQFTLRALLRMLDASNYSEWVETDLATLENDELTFIDLWAYLLARHLWPQLRRGLPSAYLPREDELTTVRGHILLRRQLARFGDRVDRVVCAWDEYSPDTAMLRLIKCACRFLRQRITHAAAMGLLSDCLFMLDDVADIHPNDALRATERIVWTRATERFRPMFALARQILLGRGPQFRGGEQDTWVFLVDMNKVFESFCRVALEDALGVVVQEQQHLGWLLQSPSRMSQLPDYLWKVGHHQWIGDAKWKLLEGSVVDADETEAEARLSTADVRQLTTYGELHRRQVGKVGCDLAVFYPGLSANSATLTHSTWNDCTLHVVPVRVTGWVKPRDALPAQVDGAQIGLAD